MKPCVIGTSAIFTLGFLVGSALAGDIYTLTDDIRGECFYDAFNFEAIPDPTLGRVYVHSAHS